MNSTDTFVTRSGAIDKGRDYENFAISYMIINLLTNPEIKNFKLASNAADFGAFDDVVLELEYENGITAEYDIQLKHVRNNRTLTLESLTSEKGKFSISKYFQSYKNSIKNKKAKVIIFTNFKYNYNDLSVDLESSTVASLKDTVDPVLNTSDNDFCVKFREKEPKDSCEDLVSFLGNFSLYANQAGASKLRDLISEKFRENFLCDQDTCEKYLQFINDWSKKDGTKEKLNKTWVQQAITVRLLSSYIHPIEKSVVVQENLLHLRKIIETFHITLFQKETNLDLARMCSYSEDHLEDVHIFNKIRMKFYLKISHIVNVNDLSYLEKTQLMWLMGKCPLVVSENEAVLKAVELWQEGRFILVKTQGSDRKSEDVKGDSVFRTLSDLSENSQVRQHLVQKIRCSLGGAEITLESLLAQHHQLSSEITPNELFKMLDQELFVIGGTKEELPTPHIERKLSTTIIDIQFLKQIQQSEQKIVIVLSCNSQRDKIQDFLKNLNPVNVNDYLQNSSKPSDGNVYICDGDCSQEDFAKICNKNTTVKQCHLFRLTQDANLEWIKTNGIIEDLEQFLLKDRSIEESELCSLQFGNKINIICANPGMGKSILAKSLKNQLFSKYWPILIHPTDVSAYFRKKVNTTFEKYIEKKKSEKYSNFDNKVMESFKNKNLITYIWDGLDEVSDANFKNVLDIIDTLSKKNILQWITSRCHLQEKLEKRFKLFSRTILQFDEMQQENFIKQRLKDVCQNDIQGIVTKIKHNIKTIRCQEVLGIPLQIYMLTELFHRNADKYTKLLNDIFSLTDLYHHFVNEKFNCYYKGRAKIEYPNHSLQQILDAYKESYVKKYEKAALKNLEDSDILQIRKVECDKFLGKIKNDSDSFGLITEVSENMTPTFVHNSYGEFFVASYFFKNYQKIPNLKDILFKERYTNIRFLFDLLMAKDSPIHIAVLYKNFDVLVAEENQLHVLDQGGRNALQVACTWGQKYPLLKTTLLEEENNTYQIDEKPGESVEREDPEYQKMIVYLSDKCNYRALDQLFNMDSVAYADVALCLFPLLHFSQKENLDVGNFSKFNDLGTLLYYGIKFDCFQIIDLVKDIPFVKTEKRNWSLLHLCAEFNSTQCLEHLLRMEKYKTIINNVDMFDVFPVTIACKKGHHNVLKMLIEAGADLSSNVFQLILVACRGGHHEIVDILLKYDGININDDRGSINSSLQSACLSGYGRIVRLLVDFGVNINNNYKRYGTPLYIACQYGHEETVKILVNAGADVNKANKYGFTPLHIACQKKYVEIVKCLINSEANINAGDNTGNTPLHVVSKNGSEEILTLLIVAKVELDKTTKKKMTSLYNACQCGNERIVETLTKAGADVNIACNEGCSPIYIACEKGCRNIVKLLLDHEVNISVQNDKFMLPLQIAQKNGFEEIANLLTNFAKEDSAEDIEDTHM